MRVGDTIHNLDGQPFRTLELAQRMSRLLASETGSHYTVDSWIGGGFVVRRHPPVDGVSTVATVPSAIRSQTPAPSPRGALSQAVPIRTRTFHPAVLRSNLRWLPVFGFALILAVWPEPVIRLVLGVMHLSPVQLGPWLDWLIEALGVAGAFWVLAMTVFFWTEWASSAYLVTGTGIETRQGLLARNTQGLRFEDIRSVTLVQSVFERLLNYGNLEFTSAGTQHEPLRFVCIARPGRVLALIQAGLDARGRAD